MAYDEAAGHHAWFVFTASAFPATPTGAADLEVRRVNDATGRWFVVGRVTALPLGVAAATGTQELDVSHASPYHSPYTSVGPDRETIRVLSLAALLREIGDPARVDLLKMDCEGAEMDCLLAATPADLARIGRLALEYHEWAGFSLHALVDRLAAAGLRMRSHTRCEKDRTGVAEFVRG